MRLRKGQKIDLPFFFQKNSRFKHRKRTASMSSLLRFLSHR